MTIPGDAWVFDTGPLRHFGSQGWLAVLRFLAGERRIYIPDSVERELNDATDSVPAVRQALDAEWIHVYRSILLNIWKVFPAITAVCSRAARMVEKLADDLLEGNCYLPFGPGGFRRHVLESGILDCGEL